MIAGKKLVATLLGVVVVGGGGGAAGYALHKPPAPEPERIYVPVTPSPTPSINVKFSPAPGAANTAATTDNDKILAAAKAYQDAMVDSAERSANLTFKTPVIKGDFATIGVGTANSGATTVLKKVSGNWIVIQAGVNGNINQTLKTEFGIPDNILTP